MADLESELRRVLAERGAGVSVGDDVPPAVLARVRRRRSARLAAGLGVVVMVVLTMATTVARLRDPEETRVIAGPSETSVPIPAPSQLQGTPLRGALVVAGSPPASSQSCLSACPAPAPTRLLDLSVSPARELARLPGPLLAEAAPVRTPSGVVVLTGEYQNGTLWLVAEGNREPVRLAERVAGFAVAADRSTVAWSRQSGAVGSPVSESTLVVARLPDARSLHSTVYAGFARVAGFAGDVVLLSTGDGAGASAATWVPGRDVVVRTRGFGTAGLGDAPRGRAVLNEGDGPCGILVTVAANGSVAAVNDTWARDLGCHLHRAFSPDGSLLASAVAAGGASGSTVSALLAQSMVDGGERLRISLPRLPLQVDWLDPETVLVVTKSGGKHVIEHCSLQTRSCGAFWELEDGLVLLVDGH